jgi:SNF2 family DNA or RNA helicase
MIAEYGGNTFTASIPLVKAMKLKQITSGFVTQEGHAISMSTEKLDACEELVQQLLPEKIVIFAHYKWEIAQIAKRVRKYCLPLIIYGGVKREDRDRYRHLFQTSDKFPVIICQLGAGGLGIDLFASRYEIFYSLDRQSDHLTQCIGRVYRTGQTKPVFIYYLLVKNSIDTVVYNSNKAKIDLSEYMVGKEIKLL